MSALTTGVHPKSGLRYIMAIRGGPAYGDVISMYRALSERVPWITWVDRNQFHLRIDEILDDERNFVTIWGFDPGPIREDRRASVTVVYSEALDLDSENMDKRHFAWLARCRRAVFPIVDAVFGHTPWMAKAVPDGITRGYVLPMGWDAKTMGMPDWSAAKDHRFSYAGAPAGKRLWMIPAMKGVLGDSFYDATGRWRRKLIDVFNRSMGNLYLSHTDVHSFSTFRTWQCAAS